MTSCGTTSERSAAWLHAFVGGLYVVMAVWHFWSWKVHQRRDALTR